MGKRPSTSDRAGCVTKVAKVEAEYTPLSKILASDPNLTAPCREMMRNALPHAIASLPEERHPYESQLIEVVTEICIANESKHRADVQADEGTIASVEERKQQAIADLEAAKLRAAEKSEVKDAKANIMLEVQQSVDQAKLALAAETEKEHGIINEKQGVIDNKVGCEESLVDVWEPLKECKLVGQRKEKNKAMARLTTMMEAAKVPESLTSALVLALRQKVDARTNFAQKAVEFAETSLKEHIASLESKIEGLEAKVSEVLACVASAETVLKTLEQKLQDAQDRSLIAENEWCSEESAAVLAKDVCEKVQAESDDTANDLAESKSALEAVLELNTKFLGLLEHRSQAAHEDVDEQMEASAVQAKTPDGQASDSILNAEPCGTEVHELADMKTE